MLVRKVANAIFYAILYAVSKGWIYLQQTRIAKYARTWFFESHLGYACAQGRGGGTRPMFGCRGAAEGLKP